MKITYVFACGHTYSKEIPDNASRDYGVRYRDQRPIEIRLPATANDSFRLGCIYALHPLKGRLVYES